MSDTKASTQDAESTDNELDAATGGFTSNPIGCVFPAVNVPPLRSTGFAPVEPSRTRRVS